MVNNINCEKTTTNDNYSSNILTNQQQNLEIQSFDLLPTTFTNYINNTVGSNMLNCDFEMNETKLVGVDMMLNGADDTITDNTTYEINLNNFKNKLTHPLSSSILKTTKSILDSTEINPNFNTYGTSSNNSIDNSTATNTLNNNILLEQTTILSNEDNTLNDSESKQQQQITKHKSILKLRNQNNSSEETNNNDTLSVSPTQTNNISYFKMFESFLYEKKASLKSGLNNSIRSIQNYETPSKLIKNNHKQSQKLKSFTTPAMRATITNPKRPIKADLVTISSLVSEANQNGLLTVNTSNNNDKNIQENASKNTTLNLPKVSPIYSLHSSSIHSSLSSSIISPTSSFLITETNKNNINHNNNNNPFEDIVDENCITLNNQNDELNGQSCSDSDYEDNNNITKMNDNDFTLSINNSNIMNTPLTYNENVNHNDIIKKCHLPKKAKLNNNVTNYRFKPRGESIISNSFYKVEIRSVFLKVGDIDTLNEKFYAEAFIEATWIDLNLSSDEKYNNETHWNPRLYILNSLGELKQQIWYNQYSLSDYEKLNQQTSDQNEDIRSICHNFSNEKNTNKNGCVIVERRRITGTFWQTLDLKNFPADVQQLTVTLCTPKQVSEVQLAHCKDRPSSVNIKCFVDSQEWRLYEHITVREFVRDSVFSNESFSAVDLTIHAARRPTFYYWNAFFLIFLITLSSLSIFAIRCHLNQSRIQTTCTLLLTSVTFKWVTNRSLPFVSYMTSLDKYSLGCILLICAQCLWHAIVSSIMNMDDKCIEPFAHYDHVAFVMFCTIFIIVHLVFIFWLIKNPYKMRRQLNKQELDYSNQIIGKRSTRLKSMLYGI